MFFLSITPVTLEIVQYLLATPLEFMLWSQWCQLMRIKTECIRALRYFSEYIWNMLNTEDLKCVLKEHVREWNTV